MLTYLDLHKRKQWPVINTETQGLFELLRVSDPGCSVVDWTFISIVVPKALGTFWKRDEKNVLKVWEVCFKVLSSEHHMAIAHMSSQKLCLLAQGMNKMKIIQNSSMEKGVAPNGLTLTDDLLAIDGFCGVVRLFSLRK